MDVWEIIEQSFFLLLIIASMGWVAVKGRNIVISIVHFWASTTVASTIIAIISRFHPFLTTVEAHALITCTFVILAFSSSVFGTAKALPFTIKTWTLLAISVAITLLFLVAGLLQVAKTGDLYYGLGMLASAEDNGKWLNFASLVSSGERIDFQDGTSGSLAVLLVIFGSICTLVSKIFLGHANAVGITIQSVFLTHAFLIAVAPLSLIPAAFLGINRQKSNRAVSHVHTGRGTSFVSSATLGMAGLLLAGAVASAAGFGHLSFETVLVISTLWGSILIYCWGNIALVLWASFIGSWISAIWLPLPSFSIAIAISGIVIAGFRYRPKANTLRWTAVLGATCINLGLLLWLSSPQLQYIASTTSPATKIDLLVAEGGTMKPRLMELVTLTLVLALTVGAIWSGIKQFGWRKFAPIRFFPIVFMLGYAALVVAYDYIVAPVGWPHYGSRKLAFGFIIVSVTLLIPFITSWLADLRQRAILYTSLAAVLLISSVASTQTIKIGGSFVYYFSGAVSVASPLSTTSNSWANRILPELYQGRDISKYPVGCVRIDQGRIQIWDMNAYFCTRFLISTNGLEKSAMPLIVPQQYVLNFQQVEALRFSYRDLLQKPILVVDEAGEVIGEMTVSAYLDLAEPLAK